MNSDGQNNQMVKTGKVIDDNLPFGSPAMNGDETFLFMNLEVHALLGAKIRILSVIVRPRCSEFVYDWSR